MRIVSAPRIVFFFIIRINYLNDFNKSTEDLAIFHWIPVVFLQAFINYFII